MYHDLAKIWLDGETHHVHVAQKLLVAGRSLLNISNLCLDICENQLTEGR